MFLLVLTYPGSPGQKAAKRLCVYVCACVCVCVCVTAQVDWLGLRVGGHPALSLHSSDEPRELSQ